MSILLCFSLTVYIKITDEVNVAIGAFGYKKNIDVGNDKKETKKEKQKKAKKRKDKKEKKKLEEAKKKITDKKANEKSFKETLDFAITLIKSIVPRSIKMLKHITFTNVKIFIKVASDQAYKTGINYGKWSVSIYSLLGILDNTFKLKLKSVDIVPDFVSDETEYDITLKVKLRFIYILFGANGIIFNIIVNTLNRKNKDKVENSPSKNKKAV